MLGVLLAPQETDRNAEALLILQETIGAIGEKPIYRYHLCNGWLHGYWKSRAYLTACVALSWKRGVYVHGHEMPKQEIEKLSHGNTLLGWEGDDPAGHGIRWYPEDMALRPEIYLQDIDPELDNFGIQSALRLWLDLNQEGLMDTGFRDNPRHLFEQELAKYSPA